MLSTPVSELEFEAAPPPPAQPPSVQTAATPLWIARAALLWRHRRLLSRVAAVSLIVGLVIAFTIPKQYKSVARIMPPDQSNSGAMMLAALATRAPGLGALGSLAGGLLGGHSTTALFVGLLRSGTVGGHLIDRFDLQHVYHTRYRVDTAKHLARVTKVSDDKKSGVITVEVEDTSPERARDLAQAYLDELNKLVTQTSTSSARRERIFIEQRLQTVDRDLEDAQIRFSEFSSRNSTVDIKEQTRAMVDVGARVEGQLLVEQSGLESLRQIYGDGNVRVRESEARIATLQKELENMTGSSAPVPLKETDTAADAAGDGAELYPHLRQMPRLAVPYADLYRQVKVQEAVYELLTQQYELARIEEAKDVAVVSVIDAPGVPEKKSFPPRLLVALCLTAFCVACASVMVLARDRWQSLDAADPGKALGTEVLDTMRGRMHSLISRKRGAA